MRRDSAARVPISTGPPTTAGKARASQNALKHGLARPRDWTADPAFQKLTQAICAETGASLAIAAEIARADLVLRHVVRTELQALSNASNAVPSASTLEALVTFTRYERRARSRLRSALNSIASHKAW